MSDKDLDPSEFPTTSLDKVTQEYQLKYLCDEVTFIMFDMDRGGFISHHGETVNIDDLWKFYYKRVPVEETIVNGVQNIVSNFFIKVWYNEQIVFDFEVLGGEKKFRLKHIDGFHAAMFLEEVDKYRKKRFGVE